MVIIQTIVHYRYSYAFSGVVHLPDGQGADIFSLCTAELSGVVEMPQVGVIWQERARLMVVIDEGISEFNTGYAVEFLMNLS